MEKLIRVSWRYACQRVRLKGSPCRRQLSSNPMFPDSALRKFQPQETPPSSEGPKKKVEEDESFLAKHGGKVATVAFAISAFLLYRFFKQGMDRVKHEDHLHDITLIEPYEANEIRLNNDMTKDQYVKVLDRFATELRRDKSITISYKDFVQSVSNTIPEWKIQSAHLLDRLVRAQNIIYKGECTLLFLLVVLSMTVHVAPRDRVKILFRIAQEMEGGDPESSEISTDTTKLIIEALTETCQVPNDKRIILIDNNAIIKEYRTKVADDFLQEYLKKKVQQKQEDAAKSNEESSSSTTAPNLLTLSSKLDYYDFKTMILDDYVCAWAECKRGN